MCGVIGRRQPQQGQEIPALEMRAFFLELRFALGIDDAGDGIGEVALGIMVGRLALGLDEDGPAGAEPAQRIVEARGDRHQLGGRGAVQVRPPKPRGALEGAVLVEDDAFGDQGRPWQIVREKLGFAAIFGEVHHDATRWAG